MNLTKKQAVEEHRKMWNWITERFKEEDRKSIECLKSEYLIKFFKNEDIDNECFCCEYLNNFGDEQHCTMCPIIWLEEGGTCMYNLYIELSDQNHPLVNAAIAERIANLPERPDEEWDIL